MKIIMLAAVAAIVFTACQNSSSNTQGTNSGLSTETIAPDKLTAITFEKSTYDFGVITQGEKVHYDFKFKNTGKNPLIITTAQATCGCTIPEYPKDPIKPGEEGIIKVVFNSEGKMGKQDKIVTITANTNPVKTEINLVGEVKESK